MPKILIADDHTIIVKGLQLVIETTIAHGTTAIAHDGASAFEKIKKEDFDLIILDISMPNTDSFAIVSNILAVKPKSRIIMFSMSPEEIYAKRYYRMGVMGYLRKDAAIEEIKNAIECVLSDKKYISQELKEKLLADLDRHEKTENQFDRLSPREFEIVQHLANGESVSEISEKLHLHTSTIGTHKSRIFEKLRCHNIIELRMLAKVHNIALST